MIFHLLLFIPFNTVLCTVVAAGKNIIKFSYCPKKAVISTFNVIVHFDFLFITFYVLFPEGKTTFKREKFDLCHRTSVRNGLSNVFYSAIFWKVEIAEKKIDIFNFYTFKKKKNLYRLKSVALFLWLFTLELRSI
jgi:hypothetical protein